MVAANVAFCHTILESLRYNSVRWSFDCIVSHPSPCLSVKIIPLMMAPYMPQAKIRKSRAKPELFGSSRLFLWIHAEASICFFYLITACHLPSLPLATQGVWIEQKNTILLNWCTPGRFCRCSFSGSKACVVETWRRIWGASGLNWELFLCFSKEMEDLM